MRLGGELHLTSIGVDATISSSTGVFAGGRRDGDQGILAGGDGNGADRIAGRHGGGAAEDLVRRRLWRVLRADHAQGGFPALRAEEWHEDRVRRRQLDG